jgi:hypothetical protein
MSTPRASAPRYDDALGDALGDTLGDALDDVPGDGVGEVPAAAGWDPGLGGLICEADCVSLIPAEVPRENKNARTLYAAGLGGLAFV